MQTHLRTRAPSSSPGYQPHPSWRWSPPQEGRQRTPLWSLSHGRALLVTSLISPTGHWCLHLPGQQHEHLTPNKSHREHVLSSGGQFLLSSWRASKAKGRRWKCLLPVPVCFPCSKDPTEQVLRGKLSLPTPPGGQESAAPWALPARRVWWFEPAPDQVAS